MTERVVILGASGGIGTSLTKMLIARGADVIACGRDKERIHDLTPHIRIFEGSEPKAVEAAFREINDTIGPITAAVNCIGSVLLKPAHLTSDEEFETTLRANLWSAFATVKGATRVMSESGGGSIVLCTTAASRLGIANHEAIAAAKGGVMGLTLSAASTYATKNIRVNAVAPGLVATPLTQRITGNPAALKASTGMHALKRIGEPAAVASMIAFLIDPKNDWITGQVMGVDGGLGTLQSRPEPL